MKQQKQQIENEHLESDLGTAAFLLVRGFRLLGLADIDGNSSRRAFRFADSEHRARDEALAYLAGERAPAKALVDAQKSLKLLLYGDRDRNRNQDRNNSYVTPRRNS